MVPAGTGTAYVTIVPNWSSLVKPIKLVTIQLRGGNGGYLVSPETFGQGTINFPGVPEVNLLVTSDLAMQGSGSGAVIFHVSRDDSSKAISVNYTVGGSALNGTDYQLLPLTVSLPVGVSGTDIVVLPQWANGVNGVNGNNSVKIVSVQLASGVGYVLGPNTYGSGALDFPQYPEVNLNVISGACTQVSGSLVFRVIRTGNLSNPITVSYILNNGVTSGAINGVDFQSLPGLVTLPAGVASADIVVNPIWSEYLGYGSAGNVSIQLGANAGYVLGSNTIASGQIVEVPWDQVDVSVPQPTASETGTTAVFHIARTGDTTLPITVNYIMGGSAVNGLNYQPLSGQAIIASGGTSTDVVLTPINVGSQTPSNTAILTVVSGNGYVTGMTGTSGGTYYGGTYTSASGTATIMSANPLGTVSLDTISNDASQISGTGTLIFHVSRTGTTSHPIQIPFARGGDAISGVDYQPVTASIDGSKMVVLPTGVSGTDIVITPIWTDQVKPVKLVAVKLLSGTGYLLGANSFGQGTLDFPNYPEISLNVVSGSVTTGSGSLVFAVTRTGTNSAPIVVNYTVGGTAVAGDDYQALPGTIVVPALSSSATIVVTPNWLNSAKPAKLFTVQVAAGNGYVLGSNIYGAGTIQFSNDSAVKSLVSLTTGTGLATDTAGSLVFHVTRSGTAANAILVNYTVGGSAVNGVDYQPLSGYVAMAATDTSVDIVVKPIWLAVPKLPQVVTVQLSAGVGYDLAGSTYGSGIISYVPWDGVSLSVLRTSLAENSPATALFRVTRAGDMSQALTVNYTTAGSAVRGVNYLALPGSAVILAGLATKDISVTLINDHVNTPTNTLSLSLVGGSNYTLAAPVSGTVTITNVPDNTVTVAVTSQASESGLTGVFTITRTGRTDKALTVPYSLTGSAIPNKDYLALSGTATIAVGATSATVRVNPLVNIANTTSPTVKLTIKPSTSYTLGTVAAGIVTIKNYTGPIVTVIAPVSLAKVTGASGLFRIYRAGPLTGNLAVSYTLGGIAVNGADYVGLPGVATILSGRNYVDVPVTPINRNQPSGLYSVTMKLVAGAGYLVGPPSGSTVNIQSYGPSAVSVAADAAASSNWEGYGVVRAIFTRTGSTTSPLTVYYGTGGTAVSGVNYSPVSGAVTIPAGLASAGVNFNTIDDQRITPDMSLIVVERAGTGYTVVSPGQCTLTIKDADLHSPTF